MPISDSRIISLGIALLLFAAEPASAQSPEKFEQVVPQKRQPSSSATKPPARAPEPAPPRNTDPAALTKELVRKAGANEEENGFCATTNWREIGDWIAALKAASVGETGPLAALYTGRAPILFRATHEGNPMCGIVRADPEPAAAGKECVTLNIWVCVANRHCRGNSTPGCKDRHGYWQLR